MPNEIIKELWQIKDGMAREHGYDIETFAAYLQSRQRAANRQVVDLHAIKEAAERAASSKPRS